MNSNISQNAIVSKAYSKIYEHDVLKRKPLMTGRSQYFGAGGDVFDDSFEDDLSTLDGKINARGRAEELRNKYINDASYQDNVEKAREELEKIAEFLEKNDNSSAHRLVMSAIDELDEILDSEYNRGNDINSLEKKIDRPIHIHKDILGHDYANHSRH